MQPFILYCIFRLTEKISELETQTQTLIKDSKIVSSLDMFLDMPSPTCPVHWQQRLQLLCPRSRMVRLLLEALGVEENTACPFQHHTGLAPSVMKVP